ncbi:MAG: hypothetical protein GC137_04325 [Alphaproteobacteria bacterium]|nr:hypothetical protein [Alphaproteobacteria bacterium]
MALTESKENLAEKPKEEQKKPAPGVADYLAGESKQFTGNLLPYLPQDLVGGSLPHIPGTEDEAVWNAASQSCGTEKVHYVYSVGENRIWYLACPSSSLASNPDSWCPLAAALPGNSEFWDKETVYLYEQEGVASALRWDPETGRMQVFLGASRTILPRVQSMDANFVTINPDIADIVPWRNRVLRTEKLSRAVIRMLIFSGLIVNLVIALVLAVNIVTIGFVKTDLEAVKQQTDDAANKLLEDASNVMQSDSIRHMVRVQQLLDKLSLSNGFLVRYEVAGNRVEWEAVVPQGLANTAIEDTTYREVSGGRARTQAPKVLGRDKGDTVRLSGGK